MPAPVKHAEGVWTIDRFLSPLECRALIRFSEEQGYSASTHGNYGILVKKDTPLAKRFFNRSCRFTPFSAGARVYFKGLNPVFRYYKAEPGTILTAEEDSTFLDGWGRFYISIYLNDNYHGEAVQVSGIRIKPSAGTAIISEKSLAHGEPAHSGGVKYLLRSDLLYPLYEM